MRHGERAVIQVFLGPCSIARSKCRYHGVPATIVIRQDFDRPGPTLEERIERFAPILLVGLETASEFGLIVCADGGESAGKRRYYEGQEEGDLGPNLHGWS